MRVYKIRYGFYISKRAILEEKSLIRINSYAEINEFVIIRTFDSPVVIGKYTQINPFTVIYVGSGVCIGDNVMIAPHCMIASGNHNYKQLDKPIRFADDIAKGQIVIEDGVRIGHNAVIGANSVVTKDVKPFEIVSGVPAKIFGNRIDFVLKEEDLSDKKRSFISEELLIKYRVNKYE
jgi:acetyltransferase-like isoleucine patch superfamily enzyme